MEQTEHERIRVMMGDVHVDEWIHHVRCQYTVGQIFQLNGIRYKVVALEVVADTLVVNVEAVS